MKPIIQAAGIKSIDEAQMLIECGFTHIGFPHFLPVNDEETTLSETRSIVNQIKHKAESVLITYQSISEEIATTMKYLELRTVQLHGEISVKEIAKLKYIIPHIIIIKSIIIKDDNSKRILMNLKYFEHHSDVLITDSFDPTTGAEGATGLTHDWSISQKIVESTKKPVILAGGLNPKNIIDAIKFVKPLGVDVHTGIEDSMGNKDKILASLFVNKAISAYNSITF